MNGPSWVVPRLLQQIQDGGRRPYWISHHANISIVDENICTKFATKMQRVHAEMSTLPKKKRKLICMRSSVERRKDMQRFYESHEPNVVHGPRNRQSSWQNVPDSFIMKIQHGGGCHIEFQKMSIFPGRLRSSTGNNCNMVQEFEFYEFKKK